MKHKNRKTTLKRFPQIRRLPVLCVRISVLMRPAGCGNEGFIEADNLQVHKADKYELLSPSSCIVIIPPHCLTGTKQPFVEFFHSSFPLSLNVGGKRQHAHVVTFSNAKMTFKTLSTAFPLQWLQCNIHPKPCRISRTGFSMTKRPLKLLILGTYLAAEAQWLIPGRLLLTAAAHQLGCVSSVTIALQDILSLPRFFLMDCTWFHKF